MKLYEKVSRSTSASDLRALADTFDLLQIIAVRRPARSSNLYRETDETCLCREKYGIRPISTAWRGTFSRTC